MFSNFSYSFYCLYFAKLNRLSISLLVLFLSVWQTSVSCAAQVNKALQLFPHYLLVVKNSDVVSNNLEAESFN